MPIIHKVDETYNLAVFHSRIASEWHPTKNGELIPTAVSPKSHKKAWWLCKNGHEWKTPIYSRTQGNNNCPNCSGQRVCHDNNLQFLEPEIASEWHPTKNGELKPSAFTCGSTKKVWWLCKNGHEWIAAIGQRATSRRNGCPHCKKRYSSIEMRIFSELDTLIGAIWHDQSFGVEVDIYLPSLKIAIEVDGSYWHSFDKKIENDIEKNKTLDAKGITLIRAREMPLKLMSGFDIGYNNREEPIKTVHRLVKKLEEISGKDFGEYLSKNHFLDDNKYTNLISKMCFPTESFAAIRPELVKEWHPFKNGNIKPENVSHKSHKRMWWVCSRGHEWDTPVYNRTCGRGCPKCQYENNTKITEQEIVDCINKGMKYKEIEEKYGLLAGGARAKVYKMRKVGKMMNVRSSKKNDCFQILNND